MTQVIASDCRVVFLRLPDDDCLWESLTDPLTMNGVRSSILWAILDIAKAELIRLDAPVVASVLLLSWLKRIV